MNRDDAGPIDQDPPALPSVNYAAWSCKWKRPTPDKRFDVIHGSWPRATLGRPGMSTDVDRLTPPSGGAGQQPAQHAARWSAGPPAGA